jgi:hypothetical protein
MEQVLLDKLSLIGFKASLIEDCVFYQDDIIFIVYVNNGIFLGKDNNSPLKKVICNIQETGLNIKTKGILMTMSASTS